MSIHRKLLQKTRRGFSSLGWIAVLVFASLASCVGPDLEPPSPAATLPSSPNARSAADAGHNAVVVPTSGTPAMGESASGAGPTNPAMNAATAGSAAPGKAPVTTPGTPGGATAGQTPPPPGDGAQQAPSTMGSSVMDADADAGVAREP